MSFQNPVGGQPSDPYERYRVEKLEADKRTKEEEQKKSPEPENIPRIALGAHLLLLFRRFLNIFEEPSEKGITSFAEKAARDNLILFKAGLEILKREDRSQDAPFLNRLSELWHTALEDLLRFRRETPLAVQFKEFIKDVDSYPEDQPFTFGYYLTEYAGQKWLPFPYMELVKKLYDGHKKDPESSPLSRWTNLIGSLAKMMEPDHLA